MPLENPFSLQQIDSGCSDNPRQAPFQLEKQLSEGGNFIQYVMYLKGKLHGSYDNMVWYIVCVDRRLNS